jgi:hypothetical protein
MSFIGRHPHAPSKLTRRIDMTVRACSVIRRIAVLTALFSISFLAPASATENEPTPTSVLTPADIDDSIARQIAVEDRQREDVTRLLQHPEVERIAASARVDLEHAKNKAATLSGSELEELAARASYVQSELAGGDTIVISATAVIIVLLLLILLTD